MSVLDEIRISEDGEIDATIVPPDDLSTEPFANVVIAFGTPLNDLVRWRLEKLSRAMDAEAAISAMFHLEDETYSVKLTNGSSFEMDTRDRPRLAHCLRRLANLLEQSKFCPVEPICRPEYTPRLRTNSGTLNPAVTQENFRLSRVDWARAARPAEPPPLGLNARQSRAIPVEIESALLMILPRSRK